MLLKLEGMGKSGGLTASLGHLRSKTEVIDHFQ